MYDRHKWPKISRIVAISQMERDETGMTWEREGMDRMLLDHAWMILSATSDEDIVSMRARTSWLKDILQAHRRWQKAMFLVEFHEIGQERFLSESYLLYLAEETPLWRLTLAQVAALLREVYGPEKRSEFFL